MHSFPFFTFIVILPLMLPSSTLAALAVNPYTNSAHGNTIYGVYRLDSPPYARGNCSHCHEQHSSIAGVSRTPADFALFSSGYTNPTVNICVDCHDGSTTIAQQAVVNHSYSYRAGGLTSDFVDNIKDAFDPTLVASTHDMDDMQAFLETTGSPLWGFSGTDPQPCTGCHNPHAVQGDPVNSPVGRKDSAARGYPISRPSDYTANTGWELWGNEIGEKMSDYVGALIYQAPFRTLSTSFEPDGTGTSDGSNLSDFNTFCTDCHNGTMSIASTQLGAVSTFEWANEAHGLTAASDMGAKTEMLAPYLDTNQGQYVLACTDCHEPHSSPNRMLIRPRVNASNVSIPAGSTDWRSLCGSCHVAASDLKSFHHQVRSSYPDCSVCHPVSDKSVIADCTSCHYHGASHPTEPSYNMF